MLQTKLNSFTIVEIVVTLLLTTLVFSISLIAYRVVQGQINRYIKLDSRQTSYLSFTKAVNFDSQTCLYMITTTDGFECWSQTKSIKYVIQDSLILRENEYNLQDSFLFEQSELKYFFKDNEILDNDEPIDEIQMSFKIDDMVYYVNAKKDYDALTLISLKTLIDARN